MWVRTTPALAPWGPKTRPDNRTPSEVVNDTGVDPNTDPDVVDGAPEQEDSTTESETARTGSRPARFGGLRHGREEQETAVVGHVREDAEPRETPVPVRQPDQEPVQRLQVEHRGQRRHEHRRPNPEPLQRGTLEVPSHRLLAHRHPV